MLELCDPGGCGDLEIQPCDASGREENDKAKMIMIAIMTTIIIFVPSFSRAALRSREHSIFKYQVVSESGTISHSHEEKCQLFTGALSDITLAWCP